MAKKTDLRVIKTKRLLKEAFITLIKKKGFEAITIQDLADEAVINRATFYLHYQDKYDLLEQISDEYIAELMNEVNISFHLNKGGIHAPRFKQTLKQIFENLEKNRNFYEVMLGANEISDFTNKIEKCLYEKFENSFIEILGDLNQLKVPYDFILSFISSAYIGVVKWWLLNAENHYTVEFMAEQLGNVITKGPMQAIGHEITYLENEESK
ncbi:TetR/AcrR family transcriptional regulator [Metabacillus malikii]|uniref:AcrR family transcriptional regulator n=1 Tax=Metabacillus malikii TaxID=1504265 RepID=A0ABT9ZCU2_9BACI|nr:TetR/AcrR family transcriptional regulator [Metabacillus malikii]MDQ0229830.1 AcrR family transcriptional regulator [Metabacillus malikii]